MQVILYDDCDTILHSRFVKKDDIIKSGETLAFDSYLVDIGDLHGDRKPLPKFEKKVTMVSKSFQTPKFGTATASVGKTTILFLVLFFVSSILLLLLFLLCSLQFKFGNRKPNLAGCVFDMVSFSLEKIGSQNWAWVKHGREI